MKTHTPILLTLLATVMLLPNTSSHAADGDRQDRARIDISGGSPAKPVDFQITEVSAGNVPATQTSENGVPFSSVLLPASDSWQEGSITILPASTGKIGVTFLGPYLLKDPVTKELHPIFNEYDDVKSEIAIIKNGSFEDSSPDSPARDWSLQNIAGSVPAINDSNRACVLENDASDGSRSLRVWHNSRMSQQFLVEEGVPVTITFMYRLGK